jgi:hypothetical protein
VRQIANSAVLTAQLARLAASPDLVSAALSCCRLCEHVADAEAVPVRQIDNSAVLHLPNVVTTKFVNGCVSPVYPAVHALQMQKQYPCGR